MKTQQNSTAPSPLRALGSFGSSRSFATLALAALLLWVVGCSSSRKDTAPAPGSTDILDLLTGFGESISKRDYVKAVGYLTPEERSLIVDANGQVPEEKQSALSSLRLARLIRMPSVRVENGYLAGIYELLPQDAGNAAGSPGLAAPSSESSGSEAASEESASGQYDQVAEGETPGTPMAATDDDDEEAMPAAADAGKPNPELAKAVDKFFKAVSQKNWNTALALMNESERSILVDDKGKLKDGAKSRLQNIDASGKEALTLQDGKLTGITLLLPAD